MLFGYLVIRILNPSYRPSGAAGDLHTRVPRKCAAFLPAGAAPTSGGWCSEHVGCLGYTPEMPDHEVLRRLRRQHKSVCLYASGPGNGAKCGARKRSQPAADTSRSSPGS